MESAQVSPRTVREITQSLWVHSQPSPCRDDSASFFYIVLRVTISEAGRNEGDVTDIECWIVSLTVGEITQNHWVQLYPGPQLDHCQSHVLKQFWESGYSGRITGVTDVATSIPQRPETV